MSNTNQKFLKDKKIKNIPLPLSYRDLEKIPRLNKISPEAFEDFIIRLANNLDRVSLGVLNVLVPEIIEIMSPPLPPATPFKMMDPATFFKMMDYVRVIVHWHVMFNNTKTALEVDQRIEEKAKASLPKGKQILIIAEDTSYLNELFIQFLKEAIEVKSKFLLPSKMNWGERAVEEQLRKRGVSYSKISLTETNLEELFVKRLNSLYVLPCLINSRFCWDSSREYKDAEDLEAYNLEGYRKKILKAIAREKKYRWKSSEEVKEEIIQGMIKDMMNDEMLL